MQKSIPWWVTQVILALIALFFIVFGIDLLRVAYHISDPFSFVMTFFASNLIILISAALLLSFIIKMVSNSKKSRQN
jgi:putative effector of murein hydrolase LrgA (UPF0299 family)